MEVCWLPDDYVHSHSLHLYLYSTLYWAKQSHVHLQILIQQHPFICTAPVSGVHMCLIYMYKYVHIKKYLQFLLKCQP